MSRFTTNCTLPPDIVNYVSQPNTRGTIDVLSTCLSTILLCTWSIQHPNVAAYLKTRGWKDQLRAGWKKVVMMVLTILAPEYLLLTAFGELSWAMALTRQIGGVAEKDEVEWSLVHSFFTNMGGFVIVFDEKTPAAPVPAPQVLPPVSNVNSSSMESQTSRTSMSETVVSISGKSVRDGDTDIEKALPTTTIAIPASKTLKQSPKKVPNKNLARILSLPNRRCKPKTDKNSLLVEEIVSNPNQLSSKVFEKVDVAEFADIIYNLIRLRGNSWALDGAQLLLARELGIISSIPNITSEEIDDIAKGDFLAKLLATIHVLWQIIQLIKRRIDNLPSSQLEVVTVAFSVCAFVTYLLYWNKPQHIAAPKFVKADRCPTKEEVLQLAKAGPAYIAGVFPGDTYEIPGHALHSDPKGSQQKYAGGSLGWFGGTGGGMLFGVSHCVAWSYHFPTQVEGLMWKISALVMVLLPLIFVARAVLMTSPIESDGKSRKNGRRRKLSTTMRPTLVMFMMFFGCVYVLARLYLLVETFRSLLYLLPATFSK